MSFSIIPVRDLSEYMQREGTILIDLREEEQYRRGHIEHAINIPYDRWSADQGKWMRQYNTVIFYCERGNQSMYAAKEMNKRGYSAISIAGGYQAYKVWKQKGTRTK